MNLFNKCVFLTVFLITFSSAVRLRAGLPESNEWENYTYVKAYVDAETTREFEGFCSRIAKSEVKFSQEFLQKFDQMAHPDLRSASILQALIVDVDADDSLAVDAKRHLKTFFGEVKAHYLTVIETIDRFNADSCQKDAAPANYQSVVTDYFKVLRAKLMEEETTIAKSALKPLVQQTN